jgi:predicted dinucleotide-binding enzyme
MKIGILGAGNIGKTVGKLWMDAGHEVFYGSRHPANLQVLTAKEGLMVDFGSLEEAAVFGHVTFTAMPYGAWPEVAPVIAELMRGKILIDAANPYPERDGAFAQQVLDRGEGAGIPIAELLPESHVVRAFTSVYFETLASEAHRSGDLVGVPVAGDDHKSVEIVARLVSEAGFAPIIVGNLARAKLFDVGTEVYNTGMSGPELAQALQLSEVVIPT